MHFLKRPFVCGNDSNKRKVELGLILRVAYLFEREKIGRAPMFWFTFLVPTMARTRSRSRVEAGISIQVFPSGGRDPLTVAVSAALRTWSQEAGAGFEPRYSGMWHGLFRLCSH